MCSAEQHDAHVHTEIKHLEQLRLGERQNNDSAKFSERYSTEHLTKCCTHIENDVEPFVIVHHYYWLSLLLLHRYVDCTTVKTINVNKTKS